MQTIKIQLSKVMPCSKQKMKRTRRSKSEIIHWKNADPPPKSGLQAGEDLTDKWEQRISRM